MADQKKYWAKVSNKGPGPRMLLLPTAGKTIQKNSSVVVELTDQDVKGIQPYIDLGHIVVEEATEEEIAAAVPSTNNDIGDTVQSGKVPEARTIAGDIVPNEPDLGNEDEDNGGEDLDNEDDVKDGVPTHVEHRGFGRWYGFAGDEKLTQAMTEDEANAYAEEHKLQKPVAADPSADDLPPEEVTPPADETDAASEEAPVNENETTS